MKKLITIVLSITLGIITTAAWSKDLPSPNTTSVQALDRIAAKVNDDIITESELNQAMAKAKVQIRASNNPVPSNRVLKPQVLKQLIYQKLQLNLAKRYNMTVSNQQLTATLQHIAKQNGLSTTQLKTSIEAQGVHYSTYLSDLKKQLLIAKVQKQAVGGSIKITPQDLADMKKKLANNPNNTEYHLANIIIPLPTNPTTKDIQYAKKTADTLFKRLQGGADFNKLAIAHSSSRQALTGSSLGWRPLPEWPNVYITAIKTLKSHQTTSQPFRTGNGFQIIKVLGTRQGKSNQTQDEKIQAMLYERKFNEALENWLQQLYYSAYIKIYPN